MVVTVPLKSFGTIPEIFFVTVFMLSGESTFIIVFADMGSATFYSFATI